MPARSAVPEGTLRLLQGVFAPRAPVLLSRSSPRRVGCSTALLQPCLAASSGCASGSPVLEGPGCTEPKRQRRRRKLGRKRVGVRRGRSPKHGRARTAGTGLADECAGPARRLIRANPFKDGLTGLPRCHRLAQVSPQAPPVPCARQRAEGALPPCADPLPRATWTSPTDEAQNPVQDYRACRAVLGLSVSRRRGHMDRPVGRS